MAAKRSGIEKAYYNMSYVCGFVETKTARAK